MTDRVHIPFAPHAFTPDDQPPGPSWCVDSEGSVLLRCACGRLLGQPGNHSIDADGTINASVLHSFPIGHHDGWGNKDCAWHVFGRLLDWTDGAQPAGQEKRAPSKLVGRGAKPEGP